MRGFLIALLLWASSVQAAQQAATELTIAYITRAGDPAYEPRRGGADGVVRPEARSPLPGAELGLKDATAVARALDVTIRLNPVALADQDLAATLRDLAARGAIAAILDLPREELERLSPSPLPVFNVRHESDQLRATCHPGLFHTALSLTMKTDALAQELSKKAWRKVLVLQGVEPADADLSTAFQTSAKKFGLRVLAVKPFESTRDPRRREAANVALLTGDTDHDAVFIADTTQDIGRYVEWRAAKPRVILGTEGLQATSWHFAAERFGAPQLNRRFERAARRPMREDDYAAWLAINAITEAVARKSARDAGGLLAALSAPDLAVETSKGTPASFRAWDNQLRQPVMLATHNAVIDYAPLEGFLHERTTLDTLGAGEGKACK